VALFQSAPAITGGRSCKSRSRAHQQPVSIRARHHWRAIHPGAVAVPEALDVSIRARHHWRAILVTAWPQIIHAWFQSAPAITGGRSSPAPFSSSHQVSFNPRPPSLAGDPPPDGQLCRNRAVSIRAQVCAVVRLRGFNPRPPSLAGDPGRHIPWSSFPRCFNPRPPSLAGDPPTDALTPPAHGVSIRARHHWRAIQRWRLMCWRITRFQSAPAITGGRSLGLAAAHDVALLFQSAPAITGGRSRRRCTPCPLRWRFNPRPPSLAGDPAVGQLLQPRRIVSIRARHHWRAILAAELSMTISDRFQSAPAITGGRSTRERGQDPSPTSFNPRPPSLAGDPCGQRTPSPDLSRFNPRPPSLAGDPRVPLRMRLVKCVSIRARHHWRAIHHDPSRTNGIS